MQISPKQAFIILTAASAVVAAPTEHQASGLSIPQVKNPQFKGQNGYLALHKTLLKWGKPIPAGLESKVKEIRAGRQSLKVHENASGGGGQASAPTTSSSDIEWLTPVTIGSRTINMDFDTGSADLWTPSKNYDGKGKTMKSAAWDITYLDQSGASGNVVTHDVTIGGFKVTGQAVEVATTVNGLDGDGLVGLAFKNGNTVTVNGNPSPQNQWVDNFCQQAGHTSDGSCVFTADLGAGSKAGTYNFGYIDKKYGTITNWVKTSSTYGWDQFSISSSGGSASIVADTGTTIALVTKAMATAYYKNISGAKYSTQDAAYHISCSTNMPDFKFTIGGISASIPGKFLNFDNGDGTCIGGITYQKGVSCQGQDACPVGDVWLKSIIAVYDRSNMRFGWTTTGKN